MFCVGGTTVGQLYSSLCEDTTAGAQTPRTLHLKQANRPVHEHDKKIAANNIPCAQAKVLQSESTDFINMIIIKTKKRNAAHIRIKNAEPMLLCPPKIFCVSTTMLSESNPDKIIDTIVETKKVNWYEMKTGLFAIAINKETKTTGLSSLKLEVD